MVFRDNDVSMREGGTLAWDVDREETGTLRSLLGFAVDLKLL